MLFEVYYLNVRLSSYLVADNEASFRQLIQQLMNIAVVIGQGLRLDSLRSVL